MEFLEFVHMHAHTCKCASKTRINVNHSTIVENKPLTTCLHPEWFCHLERQRVRSAGLKSYSHCERITH